MKPLQTFFLFNFKVLIDRRKHYGLQSQSAVYYVTNLAASMIMNHQPTSMAINTNNPMTDIQEQQSTGDPIILLF